MKVKQIMYLILPCKVIEIIEHSLPSQISIDGDPFEFSTREPRGKKSNFEVTQYKSKDEVDKAYEMEEHQQAIYQEQLPVKQHALALQQ